MKKQIIIPLILASKRVNADPELIQSPDHNKKNKSKSRNKKSSSLKKTSVKTQYKFNNLT